MNQEHNIQCIGFIMDGNRRWAKEKGLPTFEGHREGYESLKRLVEDVYAAHIPHMVVYAFSTENWKRLEDEVGYLMKLLSFALTELPLVIRKSGKRINLKVIGARETLPQSLQTAIEEAEGKNYTDPELTVWVAVSYGGRAEIVDAVNRSVREGKEVSEGTFERMLWTHDMPDPDILVRTGGDIRISNFLLWKISYSELFFTETLWPDFGKVELESILSEYATRKRRHGA